MFVYNSASIIAKRMQKFQKFLFSLLDMMLYVLKQRVQNVYLCINPSLFVAELKKPTFMRYHKICLNRVKGCLLINKSYWYYEQIQHGNQSQRKNLKRIKHKINCSISIKLSQGAINFGKTFPIIMTTDNIKILVGTNHLTNLNMWHCHRRQEC